MSDKLASNRYRGDPQKRERLLESVHVPVLNTCLLAGDRLTCCCGETVTTDYYRFDVLDKTTGTGQGSIIAGESCANRLIALSQETDHPIQKLRPFNPFQAAAARGGGGGHDGDGAVRWHTFNRELFDAINVAFMVMKIPPGSVLSQLLAKIEKKPGDIDVRMAKSLNTIIGKFGGARTTLTQRIDALRVDNPRLRQFAFPALREALAAHKDQPEVYL